MWLFLGHRTDSQRLGWSALFPLPEPAGLSRTRRSSSCVKSDTIKRVPFCSSESRGIIFKVLAPPIIRFYQHQPALRESGLVLMLFNSEQHKQPDSKQSPTKHNQSRTSWTLPVWEADVCGFLCSEVGRLFPQGAGQLFPQGAGPWITDLCPHDAAF